MSEGCGGELSEGVLFLREVDVTPGTYATIAKVKDFPQLNFTAETKECQDPEAEALADGFISHFKTGRKDAGDFTITLTWKSGDASQALLFSDYMANQQFNYRLQFADANATKYDLACLVTEWGKATPYNDQITIPVKFRIQGKPVTV